MSASEFQLIQSWFSEPAQSTRKDVILGIGDDCAIVAPAQNTHLAFSVDTLVCGVHFPVNTPAEAIAHKALAVNLSDLAAMGAAPAWFTLSLTLPEADEVWLKAFSRSLFFLASQFNITLIGGDTSRGPLSITIQVCGYLPEAGGMQRSAARIGDIIALTGKLGAASIGLDIVQQQHPEYYHCLQEMEKHSALKALEYPMPRIREGLALRKITHAALDISDGLYSDLGHILKASQVGADIELDALPLAGSLKCLPQQLAWEKALTGGDDYELCFTMDPQYWEIIAGKYPEFTAIGVITEKLGLRLKKNNGQLFTMDTKGYDHFR
jgi:thiamine-monophosphate kinase